MDDPLLQNATTILLQNATKVYYKMRQFYYKMRQLLKIAMILLQNATVITKCDVYYKLRQYKQQRPILAGSNGLCFLKIMLCKLKTYGGIIIST